MDLEDGLDPRNEKRRLLGLQLEPFDEKREELEHESRRQQSHRAVDHLLVPDLDARVEQLLVPCSERLQQHRDHGV